jgi:hypothetical protein
MHETDADLNDVLMIALAIALVVKAIVGRIRRRSTSTRKHVEGTSEG